MQKPFPTFRILTILCVLIAVALAAGLSVPDWRERLRHHFLSDTRHILARVEGDLNGHGDQITVLKVEIQDQLMIEVFSKNPKDGETALRARLILPERKDAYFQFQGAPTNLALGDVDGDGIPEILAPTFDSNLIPRLHVYKYDPAAQVFNLMSRD